MSSILARDVEHQIQSVNTPKLRDLDALEEFLWLIEQSVNVSHAVVVEVKGSTTIGQWRSALNGIQLRYTAQDLYRSVLEGPLVHELMVTNYAGYQVRTKYGNLRVENLFTGSPSIVPSLQIVSVLSVNERLGMILVAHNVLPTLLEEHARF